MVLYCVLRFWVEISGALSVMYYVVVGPLVHYREGECVAKANFGIFFGGRASERVSSGWATPWKKRNFDCTMGYPGEDVAQR